MELSKRRPLVIGLVVVIAIALGVLARCAVEQREIAAVSPAPSQPASPAKPETPPAPETAQTAPSAPAAPVPAAPAAPPAAAAATPAPTFDIVRVEPNGDVVVAGRADPNLKVDLLASGKTIASDTANDAGEFVIVPTQLAPGNYELTLRAGDTVSSKAVTVSVPEPGKGDVLVVAGEAGKPSEIVQSGPPETTGTVAAPEAPAVPEAPKAVAAAETPLRIAAVEAANGRLFVQGSGPPGGRAVIYLNDQPLAEAVIGADGRWSLTVEKGLMAGNYTVRIDQIGSDGKVVARAEVPFEATQEIAAITAPPPAPAPAPMAAPAVPAPAAPTVPPVVPSTAVVPAPPPAPLPAQPAAPAAPTASPAPMISEPAPAPSTPAPVAPAPSTSAAAAPVAPSVPPAPAPTPPAAAPQIAQAPSPSTTANPVVKVLDTLAVKRGDSLWRISRHVYGEGIRYSTIYKANTDQIRNPNLIYPGQIFILPGKQ